MNRQINILFDYKIITIADNDVCFCRLMSQVADVNIQSSVGMFPFYVVLYSSFCYQRCTICTVPSKFPVDFVRKFELVRSGSVSCQINLLLRQCLVAQTFCVLQPLSQF